MKKLFLATCLLMSTVGLGNSADLLTSIAIEAAQEQFPQEAIVGDSTSAVVLSSIDAVIDDQIRGSHATISHLLVTMIIEDVVTNGDDTSTRRNQHSAHVKITRVNGTTTTEVRRVGTVTIFDIIDLIEEN